MRKWNKLLALVLAMVMVFGLTATAFAAEDDADADTAAVTEHAEGEEDKTDAEGEEDKTDAEGEEDKTDAEGEEDKTDAEGEEDKTPAEGEEDKTPAEGEEDKTPAEGEEDKTDATEPTTPAAVTFSDVEEGRWFYDVVMKMAAAGIVNGNPDGTFNPSGNVTWGQALKMVIVLVTGEEKDKVDGGSWASGYIAFAKAEGIVAEDAVVDHNAAITRVEMCELLAKALKVAASDADSKFSDTDNGHVVALVALGVINGNPDGTFDPDGNLTRAQLCQILANIPEDLDTAAPTEGNDATKPTVTDDDPSKYVSLDGEWHFKVYRTYEQMYQYFAVKPELSTGNWTDEEAALYPEDKSWEKWDTVRLPEDDPETGGLLRNEVFQSWAEAWAVREFQLPANFTGNDAVTLLLGIVDDNDVVYINGQPVAASGFVDGDGNAVDPADIPASGGFAYPIEGQTAPEKQVKWAKSYWEIEREYSIPASVLKEGVNEIAIRIYNNNSFSGFYSGHIYALCGNEKTVRTLKGLPTEAVDVPEILTAVSAQAAALKAGDLDAYAATIAENYHNDADTKADKVAQIKALLDENGAITVTDTDVAVYRDKDGNNWYSANRTMTGSKGTISEGAVEICYAVSDGTALERGNWNRCYGTSYHSALFDKDLGYSVYLPPSYYENTDQEYPTVWLLHGRGSSSSSYRNVDNIGEFMDDLIANGSIIEMVLVMPDSGKTAFYQDSEPDEKNADGTGPWLTQLVDELRKEAESKYRLMDGSAFRGLSGNSMGAYGSLMAGLTHPELYSSIGLHMGYLPEEALETLKDMSPDILAKYDFYMDVGKQDTTVGIEGTVSVHEYLESVGKEHGYSLRDGGHNSAFYMAGMAASMKMHSDHFQKGLDTAESDS